MKCAGKLRKNLKCRCKIHVNLVMMRAFEVIFHKPSCSNHVIHKIK